ncbi:MAG: FMN-binding glutamate synthase family protein [Actinobacteria bacterium]|nr:FMN-binding glutamate synthase family protein [Actinomycetota bacterium]MBU1943738.1 FMN-binding glutamate synthase family protein [Actinomycetota bacterium]MBU2687073.1 FMN-binding glutamate synthase family protein [Actinomycetota bacterium]
MALTKVNRSAATLSKNRTPDSVSPFSGMCATCVEGCIGMCEIGKSAIRGPECIYPAPFGTMTAASEKEYPVDLSHFNIMGTAAGAFGVPADSEHAVFTAVNIETTIGDKNPIKLRLPFVVPGLGSTYVAKRNWDGLAVGCAISGTMLTIGENVCGMDDESVVKNGKIQKSPDMESRIKTYRDWQLDGYGDIVVQFNVEDTNLGVPEYVLKGLGIETVELKWGQGAKDIGGEVRLASIEKARSMKQKGYIVLPDPDDLEVVEAFNVGGVKDFERHSRLGMVTEEGFAEGVQFMRDNGAKRVFLKTGAYRPVDLARAVKYASDNRIDMLTVDGAGGGTGMSPWRMMNEWGIPTVELCSLTYEYIDYLAKQGKYVPSLVFAGGLTLEDQIFKAFALGAPYVKAIGMARSSLAAAMVGKTIGSRIMGGDLPVYIERFGTTMDEVFITGVHLRDTYGDDFEQLHPGAIGVYTYYERLAQGMRQLMAGERKFALEYITRDDICALTREAADVSGIAFVTELDKDAAWEIIKG